MFPEKVLEKVQEIEEISNRLKTSKKPKVTLNNLKTKIVECCIYIGKLDDNSEYEISIEFVELLVMLNNKYKFEKIFDCLIDIQLVLNHIKAYFSQNFWKLENLSEDLLKIEKLLESVFEEKKDNLFESQNELFSDKKSIFGNKSFHLINYAVIYCETLMQHTAVLSQLGKHDEALKKVEKCFYFFQKVFKSLNDIFEGIGMMGTRNILNVGFDNIDKLKNCIKYLEFLNGFEIPNKEDILINDNRFNFMKENIEELFESDKFKNQLEKKYNQKWILDIHISNIVKLINVPEFVIKISKRNFDENLIINFIISFSCCVFSIAAENRFLSQIEIKESEEENKKKNQPKKLLENYSKEYQLQNNKRFNLSEKIHFKALEALAFGIKKKSKLYTHFKESYKKNYFFNMQMIIEVEEPSITTLKNSIYYSNNIKDQFINEPEINKWRNIIEKNSIFERAKKLSEKIKFNSNNRASLKTLDLKDLQHLKVKFIKNNFEKDFLKKNILNNKKEILKKKLLSNSKNEILENFPNNNKKDKIEKTLSLNKKEILENFLKNNNKKDKLEKKILKKDNSEKKFLKDNLGKKFLNNKNWQKNLEKIKQKDFILEMRRYIDGKNKSFRKFEEKNQEIISKKVFSNDF